MLKTGLSGQADNDKNDYFRFFALELLTFRSTNDNVI